jgi:hypothetical protein
MAVEWFVASGILFWILFGIFSLIWISCVEREKGGPALVLLGIFFGIWFICGDLGGLIKENPWRLLWYPLGYLAGGIVWALPKWYLLVTGLRRQYKKAKRVFKEEKDVPIDGPIPKKLWEDWSERVRFSSMDKYGMSFEVKTGKLHPPDFMHNDDRLICWCAFWPWSVFWTVIREPFVRIVDFLSNSFELIANIVFRNMDEATGDESDADSTAPDDSKE